jgi:hypothetical protein
MSYTALPAVLRIGNYVWLVFCLFVTNFFPLVLHHRDRYPDKRAERLLEKAGVRHFVISVRRLGG